jgi:hypothetical protein
MAPYDNVSEKQEKDTSKEDDVISLLSLLPADNASVSPRGDIPEQIAIKDEMANRDVIVENLTPEQKLELKQYRLALSLSKDDQEIESLKAKINAISPELAQVNDKIEDILKSPLLVMLGSNNEPNQKENHSLFLDGKKRAIQCHVQLANNDLSDWKFFEISEHDLLQDLNQDWYSPYSDLVKFLEKNWIGLEYKDTNEEMPSPFIFTDEGKKEYLPIDLSLNIEQQLYPLLNTRMSEIEQKYNVKFMGAHEELARTEQALGKGPRITVFETPRHPNLYELASLEKALEKSKTTIPGENEDPLKIGFFVGRDIYAGRYFGENETIGFYDSQWVKEPNDALKAKEQKNKLEIYALHELAHHHQYMFWTDMHNDTAHASAMGWQKCAPINDWLLRGESNQYFRFNERDDRSSSWTFCNSEGQPVPSNKKLDDQIRTAQPGFYLSEQVGDNGERILLSYEVADLALVKPVSHYFDNPCEMFAEAMAAYRFGGEKRAKLAMKSPALYDLVARDDQMDINHRHSPRGNHPAALRMPNGQIVEWTEDNANNINAYNKVIPALRHYNEWFLHLPSVVYSNDPYEKEEIATFDRAIKEAEELGGYIKVFEEIEEHGDDWGLTKYLNQSIDDLDSRAREATTLTCVHRAALEYTFGDRKKAQEYLQTAIECDSEIEAIKLQGENIDGNVIADFAKLKGIKRITLVGVSLSEEMAEQISKFENLETVSLHGCSIEAKNLNVLSNSRIANLGLSGCSLDKEKLTELLKNLPNLRSLDLNDQPMTSDTITALQSSSSLDFICLPETITDEGLKNLSNASHLGIVHIGNAKNITNIGLAQLAMLPELRTVHVLNSQITDEGLDVLHQMPNLQSLWMSGEKISKNKIDEITQALPKLKMAIDGIAE